MESEEIIDLLRETRKENVRLFRNNQEIVRKSGAMSVEVGRLQKQIDDETHKSANLQEMTLALQETYMSQVGCIPACNLVVRKQYCAGEEERRVQTAVGAEEHD